MPEAFYEFQAFFYPFFELEVKKMRHFQWRIG